MRSTKRQTNIELLRILSMFLIVVLHYVFNGLKGLSHQDSFDVTTLNGGGTYVTMEPLWIISCIGVNCFVMITGYFICMKETYRWKGIIRTWIETIFYIITIGLACYWLNPGTISISEILKYISLRGMGGYWFVTCYIGLLAVAPLLAMVVNRLSKRNYQIVLCILFIICFQYTYGRIFAGYASLGWFIFLFMVAGYIRRFPLPAIWERNKLKTIWIVWLTLFVMATAYNALKWVLSGQNFRLISSANDGMMFFLSLAVFVFFVKTPMEGKKAHKLAKISPYMFGVYLIHNNPFWYKQLWQSIIPEHFSMPIIVHCIFTCLVIFLTCVLIDYLRTKLFTLFRIDDFENWLVSKIPNLKFDS